MGWMGRRKAGVNVALYGTVKLTTLACLLARPLLAMLALASPLLSEPLQDVMTKGRNIHKRAD